MYVHGPTVHKPLSHSLPDTTLKNHHETPTTEDYLLPISPPATKIDYQSSDHAETRAYSLGTDTVT